jgi:hypothetical protein
MYIIGYLQSAIKNLHKDLSEAITELNSEQLHFRPLGHGKSIAFIIWHFVRTEDIVVNSFLQKKLQIWNANGWAEKLGIDLDCGATGISADQTATMRIHDMGEFCKYMNSTFETSEAYLENLTDWHLESECDLPLLGTKPLLNVIGDILIQHASNHLGEIYYLRELQGLEGNPL